MSTDKLIESIDYDIRRLSGIESHMTDCKASISKQEAQEPAAWREKSNHKHFIRHLGQRSCLQEDGDYEPLYTHPQPKAPIDPKAEQEKCDHDKRLYGTSVMASGKHVPLSAVRIAKVPALPEGWDIVIMPETENLTLISPAGRRASIRGPLMNTTMNPVVVEYFRALEASLAVGRHKAAQYLLATEPGQTIDTKA